MLKINIRSLQLQMNIWWITWLTLPSGQTQQQLGRVPLILGMPILVSQNFDVKGGIVNGSWGTVSHIYYHVDDEGHRYLLSVVVHITDSTDENLSHLLPHNLLILADMTEISFKNILIQTKTIIFIAPKCPSYLHSPWLRIELKAKHWTVLLLIYSHAKGTEAPYVHGIPCMFFTWSADFYIHLKRKRFVAENHRTHEKKSDDWKFLNLLTLTQLGSQSEWNTALWEIKALNTSKGIIKKPHPSGPETIPLTFSNTQCTLEVHQNLLTQNTSDSQSTILPKRTLINFEEDEVEKHTNRI